VRDNLPTWVTHLYLCDPVAIACLLFQRAFWVGTTADPTTSAAETLPDHLGLWTVGNLIAAIVILGLAQRVFQKFENKVPERL